MTDRSSDPEPQPRGVLPSRRRYDRTDPDGLDPQAVLDRLRDLEVHVWRDAADGRREGTHVGPAAEDFHDAFGVGVDPDHVAAGDPDGVAMAALQGLADRLDEREAKIEHQERRIRRQREIVDEQRDDIETLREQLESLQAELSRLRRNADDD